MAQVSKRLHSRLKKMAATIDLNGRVAGRSKDALRIEDFIKKGHDPAHAAYAFVQNIVSKFSELVSELPEMFAYTKQAGAAEEEYLPAGPPMSPLTASFFTSWAFFDMRIGNSSDTLATCLIEANDIVCLNSNQLHALKNMQASRMGIYEHAGNDGVLLRLRELITDDDLECRCASGYKGRKGELWYVRVLPALPDLDSYHTFFTTPYILIEASKAGWVTFLRRTMLQVKASDERTALDRLMKFGLNSNYWNEFVLKAYSHHQTEAVFLAGIPDLQATLPHA